MKQNSLNIDIITRYLLNNSSNDKNMIDRIIQDDEKSRQEFDAYLEVWEKSADLKDFEGIDTKAGWKKVRSRMNIKPVSKRIPVRSYFLRIAAILVLALGLAYILVRLVDYASKEEMTYTEVATTQNMKEVELPDGSIIHLNKSSKIIHNSSFGQSNRDIILEGEAFFDVSRNENLPFKIYSLNSTIEVLGTSFNVKVDSAMITVGVVSGNVALYESEHVDQRIELLPDNTGIYSTGDDKLIRKNYFDRNSIAWHTKEFVFRNQPLQDVCRILADFYHLKLVADEKVQFIESVTLTCSTESLDRILFAINNSLTENIELITKDDLLIVRKH